MRTQILFNALLLTLTSGFIHAPASLAQQKVKRSDPNSYYRPAHTMSGKTIVLPIGTTFEGRMSTTISSAKSHAGQAFGIILSSPLLANGNDVVIPAGAQVVGEVVESVPSKAFKRKKGMPISRGKLRIQLNQLRMPDGTSYPLVANLAGEMDDTKGGRGGGRLGPSLGSNVAYVGTPTAFEAVAPGNKRYLGGPGGPNSRGGNRGDYVHRREFLADEIYGTGGDRNGGQDEGRRIRSLVIRNYDYWIDEGSPLTVRTAAPLRLGIAAPGEGVPISDVEVEEEGLPGRSPKNAGSDIPPIGGNDLALPPKGSAPPMTPPPTNTAPPPPAGSPSSDF